MHQWWKFLFLVQFAFGFFFLWIYLRLSVPSSFSIMCLLIEHCVEHYTIMLSLLFSQFMDIPSYLVFIRLNYVWPQTQAMCFFWWYVDVGVCNACGILVAWASIERHILVFHDKWVSTRRKRILVHYMSLFGVLGYSLCFYLLALLIPSWDHSSINYNLPWCHYSPCSSLAFRSS